MIASGPWRELYLWKALEVWVDGAKLRVSIFAVGLFGGALKIWRFIGSWSGCMVAHLSLFDHVDGFGMEGVVLPHAGLELIFVLNGA